MLTPKRIKEAELNVKQYLEDGLIKKQEFNQDIFKTLIQNSDESLEEAQRAKSSLWIIVMSYYSMFYMVNAVLLTLNYKIGNKIVHKVTSEALIVFIRNKLSKELIENYETIQSNALSGTRTDELIQYYEFEKHKRSLFQYSTTERAKINKAKTSLQRAKEFIFEMKKLI